MCHHNRPAHKVHLVSQRQREQVEQEEGRWRQQAAAPHSFNDFSLLKTGIHKHFPPVLCTWPLTSTMTWAAGTQGFLTARAETSFRRWMKLTDPLRPLPALFTECWGCCPQGAARASLHGTPADMKHQQTTNPRNVSSRFAVSQPPGFWVSAAGETSYMVSECDLEAAAAAQEEQQLTWKEESAQNYSGAGNKKAWESIRARSD